MDPGVFFLIRAPSLEWDEVLALLDCGLGVWIGITTDGDNQLHYVAWQVQPGQIRRVAGVNRARSLPLGVPHVPNEAINWTCYPNARGMWEPTAALIANLVEEARLQLPAGSRPRLNPGGGLCRLEVEAAAPAGMPGAALGAVVPAAAVGAPGLAGPPPPADPALAPPAGPALGPLVAAAPSPTELAALVDSLRADLQIFAGSPAAGSGERHSREKKSRSGDDRGRRRRRRSSSSRSSSERRSSSRGRRIRLRWDDRSRNRSISPGAIRKLQVLKFKTRADLVAFSQKHPGALGAQFLIAVREKLMRGHPTHTKQLRDVDVSTWAARETGLKELRDLREVQTLSLILGHINSDRLPHAVDAISQRVKSILMAKAPKGSWEKSAAVELLPGAETALALPTEIALVGLPA